MNMTDTFILLGVQPPDDDNTAAEALAVAFLKNINTNEVIRHDIFRKKTQVPTMQISAKTFISSVHVFHTQEELLEKVQQEPNEVYLITFSEIKGWRTSTFYVIAQSLDLVRETQREHKAKDAFKNTEEALKLSEEDNNLYLTAIQGTNMEEIEEVRSLSTPSSSRNSSPPPLAKRVALSPPKNDLPAENSAEHETQHMQTSKLGTTPLNTNDNVTVSPPKQAKIKETTMNNLESSMYRKSPTFELQTYTDYLKSIDKVMQFTNYLVYPNEN